MKVKPTVQYMECRRCCKAYDPYKSRADWKGYCSQRCFHQKARLHGYSPAREKKYGHFHSEFQILNRAGQIGDVPALPD